MEIVKANLNHLNSIAGLFNQYRVFYKQSSDEAAAALFLKQRIEENESVIFLALGENNKGMGFVQLYPTFSSVSMERFFILNDLFVLPAYRNMKIGEALLSKAKDFCKNGNFKGLALETAVDNPAQKLYERLGWEKDVAFFHYFWKNK